VESTPQKESAFGPRSAWLIAGLLALTHLALAVTAAQNESPTFDEPTHLTAGYSYWLRNDYRLDPENGNLPARWAALPLLFDNLRFPGKYGTAWQHVSQGVASRQFFFELGNDASRMIFAARLMMSLFGAALCLVIFAWARSLFGAVAGLVSETIMVFDPNMLAHGALVTADVAAAFFFTAAVWSIWRLFHVVRPTTLILAALSVAGLFLTKMSAPCFLVMAATLALLRVFSKQPIQLVWPRLQAIACSWKAKAATILSLGLILAAFTFMAVWAAFGFRYSALSDDGRPREIFDARWNFFLDHAYAPGKAFRFVRDHHLLPEAYIYGITYVAANAQARPSFLDERWSNIGFRSFFLRAFYYKTPLPVLALLTIALIVLGALRTSHESPAAGPENAGRIRRAGPLAPLLVLIIVYAVFAWSTRLNIGHRHLLPLYPAVFILCGGAWFLAQSRSRVLAACVLLLISWQIGASLAIRPHYLAYFNQLAGGPANGYKHLVDSSLDWGQDLPEVKSWIDHLPNGEAKRSRVYLAYFGTAKPAYYGINATILPEDHDGGSDGSLGPGWYFVSATVLEHVYEQERGPWAAAYEEAYRSSLAWSQSPEANSSYTVASNAESHGADKRAEQWRRFRALRFGRLCAYLRHRQPIANIGYSILVFHLTQADLACALQGPPAELTPTVEVADD
jgi:4-amino-4-deoxy-L-arabinose transferase-like glycosyltransferase